MATGKIPIAGLQLLLLIHATKSFVLLTANIEDVKKLAMKFVSESLAEKIATFIAQAAQNMISQASEEVHRDVSEENKEYNIKDSSSEREYRNNRHMSNAIDKEYKKDDVFSQLDRTSRYVDKKAPVQYTYTLDQDEKQFKSKVNLKDEMYAMKFRANSQEDKKSNTLNEDLGSEKNTADAEDLSSSCGNSIEGNDINDVRNKTEDEPVVNFRSGVKEEVGNGELVATSGNLILIRTTTNKPSDDEKSEGDKSENESKKKKDDKWF